MDKNSVPMASPPAGSGLKCFIVEDSPLIRDHLIATLEEMLDAEVVGVAEDERSARDGLRGVPACDLVIIDIFLKAGTGLDVLQHAKALQPAATRVVLTNFATADMRRKCLEIGAHRVFDKSAELDEMLHFCGDLGQQLRVSGGDKG